MPPGRKSRSRQVSPEAALTGPGAPVEPEPSQLSALVLIEQLKCRAEAELDTYHQAQFNRLLEKLLALFTPEQSPSKNTGSTLIQAQLDLG